MKFLQPPPPPAFRFWIAVLCWLMLPLPWAPAASGFLQMTNGYFWDPDQADYFIPRGIAYQTWNKEVGANQSFPQLEYDLIEFKKMRANSVRCEIVWGDVEVSEGVYDWRKADYLIAKAEALGLKLFVIIGYQYPPKWFLKEWRNINDRYAPGINETNYVSDVINYEHPKARELYQKHIATVTDHFKNSTTIGAWILGNEYAYFDLWEDPTIYVTRRFIGYDPISRASFQNFLAEIYNGDLATLNANWGRNFASFDTVEMPAKYPGDRNLPGYHDLIQWRKRSIGDFVALGAVAARKSDPNHLVTYSMVGGIFNGTDANNTCEDAKTIVARCRVAGAPLDFWSINNYAWASFGSELRTADFGIAKYQEESGLPVMISETGHSSTEDSLGDGASERQPKALPGQLWESLMSGAIGTHLFHWSDRSQYTRGYFLREKGFGIVNQDRSIKTPVYQNIVAMFQRMADIRVENLLGGSSNPPPDIQFFWSTNADMGWPRANQENCMIWGALKRLGYQPGIIDDKAFERGDYTNAPALLLSRAYQMNPDHLERVANEVINAGIHVHANADLPGQFDAYHRPNPLWATRMNQLFGLDVTKAVAAWDASATNAPQLNSHGIDFKGTRNFGFFSPSYTAHLDTWKIWHGIKAASGTTIATHRGDGNSQPAMPAVQIKDLTRAKTAVFTFALGDTFGNNTHTNLWDTRYEFLHAVYRAHFGIVPPVDLSGPGARYVVPDYRVCRNGSILISLLNEHTNRANVTVTAPSLLAGKIVENLTAGGIVPTNSDGSVSVTLLDDDYVWLYAYDRKNVVDNSLVNSNPNKIWFEAAPLSVLPRFAPYEVKIGVDVREPGLNLLVSFEETDSGRVAFTQSAPLPVSGNPIETVSIQIPQPGVGGDAIIPDYRSSRAGGSYAFHARLERAGTVVSEAELPVRVSTGLRSTQGFPSRVVPGGTYQIPIAWEELPSYDPTDPMPLSRAALWDSIHADDQHFTIAVSLQSNGQTVATDSFLTSTGTDAHTFNIAAPANAPGPFTWSAELRTAPQVLSHNLDDGFEGRDRGAVWPPNTNIFHADPSFIAPWASYNYAFPNSDQVNLFQNQGVQLDGSEGSQSAFLVITNPPNQIVSTFGLFYVFPSDWPLPADINQWSKFVFSYDFNEWKSNDCLVEMQIKNDDPLGLGKWLEYAEHYNPGTNRWHSIGASLAQFVPPPGLSGVFEPDKVHAIVLNIRMLEPSVQYVGSFDNIRFHGPETALPGGEVYATYGVSYVRSDFSITIALGNNRDVIVSWQGGVLQTTDDVSGHWQDLFTAKSPATFQTTTARQFFRVRN